MGFLSRLFGKPGSEFLQATGEESNCTLIASMTTKYYLQLKRSYGASFPEETSLLSMAGILDANAYILMLRSVTVAQIVAVAKETERMQDRLVEFLVRFETLLLSRDNPECSVDEVRRVCEGESVAIRRSVKRTMDAYTDEPMIADAVQAMMSSPKLSDLRQQAGVSSVKAGPRPEQCDFVTLYNKGVALLDTGHHQEALNYFSDALQVDQSHANAWSGKGMSLEALGRQEEATQCYARSLELNPSDASVWIRKGDILRQLHHPEESIQCFDEAIRCCEEALEADECRQLAWTLRGSSLASLYRHEEAIQCYEKALGIDTHFVLAWMSKGYSLDELQRHDEAIGCYDKALDIDPTCAQAWTEKAQSLEHLSRHIEAVRCYDRSLQLDPTNAFTWTSKGVSLERHGHVDEALHCYDKALELKPADAYARLCKKNLQRSP
jgi:tetratricopeptide (TPR) repeat protein